LGWFFYFVITSGSGFLKPCFQRTDGFYNRTSEIPSRFFDQFFNFVRITIYSSKAVIWSRVCILDLYPLIFFCLEKGRTTQHWFFCSCLKERENHPLLVFTHVCWFFLLKRTSNLNLAVSKVLEGFPGAGLSWVEVNCYALPYPNKHYLLLLNHEVQSLMNAFIIQPWKWMSISALLFGGYNSRLLGLLPLGECQPLIWGISGSLISHHVTQYFSFCKMNLVSSLTSCLEQTSIETFSLLLKS
jgi:hypothetical protein